MIKTMIETKARKNIYIFIYVKEKAEKVKNNKNKNKNKHSAVKGRQQNNINAKALLVYN